MVDKGPAYIGIVLRTGAEKYPWLTYAGYLLSKAPPSLFVSYHEKGKYAVVGFL